jgi:hypothetical protein
MSLAKHFITVELLQCAGFVTTTDVCCGLGKYGGLMSLALHQVMLGGMNSIEQMLSIRYWLIMYGLTVSTPKCAILWIYRIW